MDGRAGGRQRLDSPGPRLTRPGWRPPAGAGRLARAPLLGTDCQGPTARGRLAVGADPGVPACSRCRASTRARLVSTATCGGDLRHGGAVGTLWQWSLKSSGAPATS